MTPSQERQVMKNIKDLLEANAEMDIKQEKDISALEKRVKALETAAKPVSPFKSKTKD